MGGFQLHTAGWINLTNAVVNTKEARHQGVYTMLIVRFQAKLTCAVITSRDNKLTPGGWQPWEGGELERRASYLLLWCWCHGWVQTVKIYWTVHLCVFFHRRIQFSSVAQSCRTLWPHGLQPSRLPCPSPTPRVYSNSCPSSWWCHPTISSSVIPFSCLQSLPASGSFPLSQFFASGGQSIWTV